MFRGSYVLNMADGAGEPPDPSQEVKDPDEGEEPDESTPAGKAFAKQRERIRVAEEKTTAAERERDLAKAREDALKEALVKAEQKKAEEPKEEKKTATNPADVAYVKQILSDAGLDDETINTIKSAKNLPEQTQALIKQQTVDRACSSLEKKWAGSVPFDRDAAITYATKNSVPGSTVEECLDLAHQRMNEDKILDWKIEERKKKLKSPALQGSGTGKKEIRSEKPSSTGGYRKMAHDLVG